MRSRSPRERKLVAAVIYNRLKQGIPLGIDATSRFETRNWTEPLTNAVLRKDTPYNTRINTGLPPGPIGNPGLASLQAAAKPADVGLSLLRGQPLQARHPLVLDHPGRVRTGRPALQPGARSRRRKAAQWLLSTAPRPQLRVTAWPVSRSPTAARRGSTRRPTPRWGSTPTTSACRCRRRCSQRPSAPCRDRASGASTSRSRTRSRRSKWPTPHPKPPAGSARPTRSASMAARSPPRTPTPRG